MYCFIIKIKVIHKNRYEVYSQLISENKIQYIKQLLNKLYN